MTLFGILYLQTFGGINMKCYKCGKEISAENMRVCPDCGIIACSSCTSDNICENCICDLTYIH